MELTIASVTFDGDYSQWVVSRTGDGYWFESEDGETVGNADTFAEAMELAKGYDQIMAERGGLPLSPAY